MLFASDLGTMMLSKAVRSLEMQSQRDLQVLGHVLSLPGFVFDDTFLFACFTFYGVL